MGERIDNLIAEIKFFISLIESEEMMREDYHRVDVLEDCISQLQNYRQKLVRDFHE